MLKKRMRVSVDTGHWGTRAACGFMLAAAVLRLWHYLPGEPEPVIFTFNSHSPVCFSAS